MTNVGNSAASRDKAFYLHPYTNLKTHETVGPLVIERGSGVHVFDDSGKSYIEGMAGLWCTSLGFGEERLVEAAARQMRKLPFYHSFGHKAHDPGIDLAEALIGMAPVPMSKVFFTSSGSEANDTVVKLVWYHNNALGRPNKKKIIARQKGYHGVTVASASLTGLPHLHRDFDLPIAGILHTDCPHFYRYGEDGETEEDFAIRMANQLEQLILAEGPDTIAAFIAEPVMGAGGVIVPPASYFDHIQPVLKRYDILFIADEVICGFGRTGSMFGSQTFNLKPDIITVAKALSSAYLPIAAVMISEPIYQTMVSQSEKIGTFGHGYTYSGHPVSAAVALETLKIYQERDIVGHVRSVAPTLQQGLRRFADHPLVGEVRGVGLIAGVEIVADKVTKAPFDPKLAIGGHVARFAQDHGLIVRAMGDTIGFCPPLVITAAELDDLVDRFGKALDATLAMVTEKGLAAVA
ncbi:aminotransferase [Skermanella stibiiresistens SB22]|uniref:Aminotransferase n=1 Tax=Skermanella stibiiresistens SB22 TaxID=1385369 RepID=W9GZN0_9PROT|nr:aspartate aminotransferase family protein [Skermanella stibiiresistens]EWY39385.1 aminotransferase [Skermanella stibiiresistens SB22]